MTIESYIETYILTPPHERARYPYSHYLSNRTGNAILNWIASYFDKDRGEESWDKANKIMESPETLCNFLYENRVDIYSMKWVGKKAVSEMAELFRNTLKHD